jgi:hypothetical protein
MVEFISSSALDPNVAEVGELQSKSANGKAVVVATANPWQRRIWMLSGFPKG